MIPEGVEHDWQLLEEKAPLEFVRVFGGELKRGDRVRLLPRQGGDIFDLALAGKVAIVEAIEQDYEDKVHLAVVLEDDPGRDLGMLRQPGHRFFFAPEEVEPHPQLPNAECGMRIEEERLSSNPQSAIPNPQSLRPRILIAGIGNIFLGDDAFGSEVARRLMQCKLPTEARVVDFGIRGFDLVYALMEGHDVTIFVDATPRGGEPGTLYTIEPDLSELNGTNAGDVMVETHGMNPLKVLGMVKTMGGEFKRILLVGCEPAPLDAEEGHMGLSEPVAAAVDEAVKLVESLVTNILEVHRRSVTV